MSTHYYNKASQQCREVGDKQLLIIPPLENRGKKTIDETKPHADTNIVHNQSFKSLLNLLLCQTANSFSDNEDKEYFSQNMLQILEETQKQVPISVGLFNFQRIAVAITVSCNEVKDSLKLYNTRINYHKTALDKCKDSVDFQDVHNEALVKCYRDLGKFHYNKQNYPEALKAQKRALDITLKHFGDEHARTADSYHLLGITQHELGDYTSALQSKQHGEDVRRKLIAEEHAQTADSYNSLEVTQNEFGDHTSALQSQQHPLDVRRKLFGEEHAQTAHSYDEIGVTQHQLGDYTSALQSHQHALDVRRKLFGEEDARTAVSYHLLGVTQHKLGDYTSALHSKQQSLDVTRKLVGEEHAHTAH